MVKNIQTLSDQSPPTHRQNAIRVLYRHTTWRTPVFFEMQEPSELQLFLHTNPFWVVARYDTVMFGCESTMHVGNAPP